MPAQRYTSPSPRSSSKPYTRPSRPSRAKTYIDISDDEAYSENAPALSSPSSNGNDGSSDYDPSVETPLKAKGSKQSLMLTFYDEEDDMKPDFSDDEISYPGIVGDEHVEISEDEEEYGKAGKGKGKGKTAKSTTTPKKGKAIKGGSVGGSGKKPGVGWTAEEDWVLFQHLHPKVTPNWASVAANVGRDSKASPCGGD